MTEEQLELLCAELEELLAEYGEPVLRAAPAPDNAGDGAAGQAAAELIGSVVRGAALHDSLVALTAHYAAQGFGFRQITELAEGLMLASTIEHDERWKARYADIPRLAQSALRKYEPTSEPFPVVSHREFMAELRAPAWLVNRVFQRGYLYALTAYWGHGKTALMLTFALCCAAGRAVATLQVARCKVMFLCGENVDDVRLRLLAVASLLNISLVELDGWLFFTQLPFAIEDAASRERFIAAAAPHAPYGLLVIDTGPAHSEADEENANRQMHVLATGMRALGCALGEPCVVALMHPAKGATKETMQPRGGGAFSGAIDGELVAWKDDDSPLIEFFHRAKFRGPGFAPMTFELKPFPIPDLVDNFGQQALTVAAIPGDETDPERVQKERWQAQNRVLYAMYTDPEGSMAEWARACCWTNEKGDGQKWRVQRTLKALIRHKLVNQTRAGRYVLTDQGKKEGEKSGRI